MTPTTGFQEILRRLAIVDERFADDQAGLRLCPPAGAALDAKTAALVQIGALAAIGSPEVCLEWSATRALAAGATENEITGVLLVVAPVIGLGRAVSAAPGVAGALGYDIEAGLDDCDVSEGCGRAPSPSPPVDRASNHVPGPVRAPKQG